MRPWSTTPTGQTLGYFYFDDEPQTEFFNSSGKADVIQPVL